MKKGIAITLIVVGIVLIILGGLSYSWLTSYVPAGNAFTLSGMLGFLITSPVIWVALILIGVGIYGLYKNKKK
jgi:xanthosine utilization system XapX-like protein